MKRTINWIRKALRPAPRLPVMPSALLQLAMDDFERAVADPGIRIDMDSWMVRDEEEGICYVCLAGCVMLQTLNLNRENPFLILEQDVSRDVSWRMRAIDEFRQGYVKNGVRLLLRINTLTKKEREKLESSVDELDTIWDVADYEPTPSIWKRDMQDMINYFKQKGL